MQGLVKRYDEHESVRERAQRQRRLVAEHSQPLITLTTHLPKHMAQGTYAKQLFQISLNAVCNQLIEHNLCLLKSEVINQDIGDEAMFVIAGTSASKLKRAMIMLEKNHLLGALMNVDVMDHEGKMISRKSCEIEPRKCLICDNAASYCSTIRKHSSDELETKVIAMLENHLKPDAYIAENI